MLYTKFTEGPYRKLIADLEYRFMTETYLDPRAGIFIDPDVNALSDALNIIVENIEKQQNIPYEDIQNLYDKFQNCKKYARYNELSSTVELLKSEVTVNAPKEAVPPPKVVPEITPEQSFQDTVNKVTAVNSFFTLTPPEQVRALCSWENVEIMDALKKYVEHNPNYLIDLAKFSQPNAEYILGTKLGRLLDDKAVAEVIYYHRAAMWNSVGGEYQGYFKKLDALLKASDRSLNYLLEDRPGNQARPILLRSKVFIFHPKVVEDTQPQTPLSSTKPSHVHHADDAINVPQQEAEMLRAQRDRINTKLAMEAAVNYYMTLNINPHGNEDDIKADLKKAKVKYIREGNSQFQNLVTEAEKILLDPRLKSIYDNALRKQFNRPSRP